MLSIHLLTAMLYTELAERNILLRVQETVKLLCVVSSCRIGRRRKLCVLIALQCLNIDVGDTKIKPGDTLDFGFLLTRWELRFAGKKYGHWI